MKKSWEKKEKELKEEIKTVKAQQTGEAWYTTKYPQRLVEKAERDEYIDLTELRDEHLGRDKPQEDTIGQNDKMELVMREKQGPTTSKKDITTPAEFMILAMSYINLLRHIAPKGKERLACAIKYFQWMGVLLLKNTYKIQSVFAFDRATRQIKASSLVWDYDANIAAANLQHYHPGAEQGSLKSTSNRRKFSVKRPRDGIKSTKTCKHYARGKCDRSEESCRFSHRCDSCGTTANDKHDPSKCSVMHLIPSSKSQPSRRG